MSIYCETCHIYLQSKYGVSVHLKSLMHKDNLKLIEYRKQFLYACKICKYYTNLKSSYTSHLEALYHIKGLGLKHLA